MKPFEGTVITTEGAENEVAWRRPDFNRHVAPEVKKIHMMQLNFGPQHPAAHGVLRLVLQLEGEVSRLVWVQNGRTALWLGWTGAGI